MGNLRYIFMLIVSLFNQRIQYFQKLNKINSRSWTMKRRLQEGRDRGVIHIQPLGENSVAGVTLAVVLGGVRGGRRKFHCRANECTARMYWVPG